MIFRGTSDAKIPEDFGAFLELLFGLYDAEKSGTTVDTGDPSAGFNSLCKSANLDPGEMREMMEAGG